MNPWGIIALAGGVAVATFAIWVKSTQNAAFEAGRATEAAANSEEKAADVEKKVDVLQAADEVVAAQRDPASGAERLHAGTA